MYRMAEQRGIRLEVLRWSDNQTGQEHGKGFGEGRLRERAVADSLPLQAAPAFSKSRGASRSEISIG